MASASKTAGAIQIYTDIGDTTWTDSSNAQGATNSTYARSSAEASAQSYYLVAKSFGFTEGVDWVTGDILDGYEVTVRRKGSGGSRPQDASVVLWNTDTYVGTDQSAGATWSATDESKVFGGPTNKWGDPFELVDWDGNTDLGCGISAYLNGDVGDASEAAIDSITLTIYFHTQPVVVIIDDSIQPQEDVAVSIKLEASVVDSCAIVEDELIACKWEVYDLSGARIGYYYMDSNLIVTDTTTKDCVLRTGFSNYVSSFNGDFQSVDWNNFTEVKDANAAAVTLGQQFCSDTKNNFVSLTPTTGT